MPEHIADTAGRVINPASEETSGKVVPARSAAAVAPNDAVDIPETRALYVGTGGNVKVTFAGDTNPVLLKNIVDGTLLPLAVKRVWAADLTADDIVALR